MKILFLTTVHDGSPPRGRRDAADERRSHVGVITENSQRRTLSEKNNFINWLRSCGLRDILVDGGKKPNFHCEKRVQN